MAYYGPVTFKVTLFDFGKYQNNIKYIKNELIIYKEIYSYWVIKKEKEYKIIRDKWNNEKKLI
jgi:hypothetical protein